MRFRLLLNITIFALIFVSEAYSQCQIGEEDKGVYEQMKFGMDNHLYNDAKIRAKILLTKYGYQCPDLYLGCRMAQFYD